MGGKFGVMTADIFDRECGVGDVQTSLILSMKKFCLYTLTKNNIDTNTKHEETCIG